MSTQGDLIGGRYRLQAAVSDRTWRALDETTGGQVVLRDVSGAADADLERIAADARTPALTAHPATVSVLDYVVGDRGAWLVTEHVPGRTLASAIAEWGPLPLPQVATIAAGVLAAVVAEGSDRAVGPEDVLLADDGRVLVGGAAGSLPDPAGSLPSVAAVVVFAAEGRSVFADASPANLSTRPELNDLLDALTSGAGDRAALGRAWAELGRLGIAAPDPDRTQPITASDLGDSVAESAVAAVVEEFRTQPMSVAEVVAAPADSGVGAGVDPDATRPITAADLEDSGVVGLATQPVSADELFADSTGGYAVDPNATRPITAADLEDSGVTGLPTEAMTAAELVEALAESATDPNATRPITAADLEDSGVTGLPTEPMTAADLVEALAESATDPNATRPITAADLEDSRITGLPTEPMSASELLADSLADSLPDVEPTEPLSVPRPGDSADGSDWARPLSAADLAASGDPDPNVTRPLTAADLAHAGVDPLATRPLTAADLAASAAPAAPSTPAPAAGPVDPEATSAIDMAAYRLTPPPATPMPPAFGAGDALLTRELPVRDAKPPTPAAPHRTQVMPTTDEMSTIPVPANLGQPNSGEEHTLPEPIPLMTQAVPPNSGQWAPGSQGAPGRQSPYQGAPGQGHPGQNQMPAFPGHYPPPHEQRPDLVPPGRGGDAVPPGGYPPVPPTAYSSIAPPTLAGTPAAQQSGPWGPQATAPTNPWGPQGTGAPGPNQGWQQGFPQNQAGGPQGPLNPNQPNFAFGQPPQPFFPPPVQPPKKNNGRTAGIAVIAVIVVAAIVAGIVLLTHKKSSSDHVANTGQTSAPGGASDSFPSFNAPTTGKTTAGDTQTSPSSDQSSDGTSDDASAVSLDDQGTDQTPFEPASFFPESFTDESGVQFTKAADGPAECHQSGASSTLNNILADDNCLKMVNASYLDSDDKILISVVTYAFPTKEEASKAFASIQAKHGIDLGLWCPESGAGSEPCHASSSDYQAASRYEWYQQDHRYLTTAVAIYTNLRNDPSKQDAESAASKKAVDSCGPQYYLSSQGN